MYANSGHDLPIFGVKTKQSKIHSYDSAIAFHGVLYNSFMTTNC